MPIGKQSGVINNQLQQKNNKAENLKRIKYTYKPNQKVLIEVQQPNTLSTQYDGPYKIVTI